MLSFNCQMSGAKQRIDQKIVYTVAESFFNVGEGSRNQSKIIASERSKYTAVIVTTTAKPLAIT